MAFEEWMTTHQYYIGVENITLQVFSEIQSLLDGIDHHFIVFNEFIHEGDTTVSVDFYFKNKEGMIQSKMILT